MSLYITNSSTKNKNITLDPRFILEPPEEDDIQNIEQIFGGLNEEENESQEINGINNVNQNPFDIFNEKEEEEEEVLKKKDPKKDKYGYENIPKLKNKTKKRKQLSSLKDNGNHKNNLAEKKLVIPKNKEIKKENTNQKSSSKSKEFLIKKTKRNSSH